MEEKLHCTYVENGDATVVFTGNITLKGFTQNAIQHSFLDVPSIRRRNYSAQLCGLWATHQQASDIPHSSDAAERMGAQGRSRGVPSAVGTIRERRTKQLRYILTVSAIPRK